MSSQRISDLALLLSHALQCESCRHLLLTSPDRALIGRKIPDEQRQQLLSLNEEDFENYAALASAVNISSSELIEAIDHPRARLRHL